MKNWWKNNHLFNHTAQVFIPAIPSLNADEFGDVPCACADVEDQLVKGVKLHTQKNHIVLK